MLGTIDGLARINYQWSMVNHQWSMIRGQVPDVEFHASRFTLRQAQSRLFHISRFTPYLPVIVLLIVSLLYHNLRGYSPLAQLQEWPEVTPHQQLGREIAASIPTEASVLAQAQLILYVAHRYRLGIWRGPLDTGYDYYLA
jgi:hypothetical protein